MSRPKPAIESYLRVIRISLTGPKNVQINKSPEVHKFAGHEQLVFDKINNLSRKSETTLLEF